MDRAELERLDREGLVLRAQAAGVRRARLLTRPELVDELLRLDPSVDPAQLKRTRGLFGRARDLLTRVVERGLHLPDAADRLRAALGNPLPEVPRPEPQAVPTVTLAEIYAAQGHKQRALETLRRVLETEPDHGGARALLEKLEAADYVAPPPPLPPETDETARDEIGGNLAGSSPSAPREFQPESAVPETEDAETPEPAAPAEDVVVARSSDEPATDEPETRALPFDEPVTLPRNRPETTGEDECIAIPIHAQAHAGAGEADSSYVWWRLSESSWQRIAEEAFFFVRLVVIRPTWDGPSHEIRDTVCDPAAGELLLHNLPPGAVVRVAVGMMDRGSFVPIAHSPAIETTPARALVRRTLEGTTPIALDDPGCVSIAIAAERAARVAAHSGSRDLG